jgi:Acetyltransferase (GNAT) domain
VTPVPDQTDWDVRLSLHTDSRPTMTVWWAEHVRRAFGGELLQAVVQVGAERVEALVHVGGALAPDGFLLGALGHGAVRAAGGLGPLSVEVQCRAAQALESELRLPCVRLVTPPVHLGETVDVPGAEVRTTQVVPLPSTAPELWASFPGSVRTAVRAGARAGDVVERVTATDASRTVELLHATQARVQAGYLTPPALVEQLLAEPDRVVAVGVRRGGVLVCVSLFVIWERHCYYTFNGYEYRTGQASPTYAALNAGLLAAQGAGCTWVDLGHSATVSLYQYKQQWGGQPQTYLTIHGPFDAWSDERAP